VLGSPADGAVDLLIDENVPDSVARYFRERGHRVTLVREILPRGTADPIVALVGDELRAVVVTWNHKDFKRLIARIPESGRRRFRNLGLITFRCSEANGRRRVEELIEWIEFEYAQAQRLPHQRLMLEIGESYYRSNR
jgi:predicted nuclease of predicted toxin-antitoxin system